MKLKLLFAFTALYTNCFSQTGTATKMAEFSGENYNLQYPVSWSLDTSKNYGADLFIFLPLQDDTDKFRENVNVLIQNLKGQNIDLNMYKQFTEKQVTDLANDGKIFESSITKFSDGESFRIIYAMTQGNFRLKITTICRIHDETAYLITFTSELDKYETYKKISDQILNSFHLTK